MAKTQFMTNSFVPAAVTFVALPFLINIWLSAVSENVAHPYLDEVFHVGQAQTYCDGRFHDWDNKITTPPGLYLVSYLVYRVSGSCDLYALRALNGALLLSIFLVVVYLNCPSRSRALASKRYSFKSTSILPTLSNADPQQIHTAFNICLFPPLFFFCGLYYTDVGSTLFVLLFFKHFFDIHSRGVPSVIQSIFSIFLGLSSLTFRQTNIFWVAVFPLGFVVLGGMAEKREQKGEALGRNNPFHVGVQSIAKNSWQHGALYDPQVRGAWTEDYALSMVSIAALAVRTLMAPYKLLRLVRLVMPYVTLLGLFGAFVVWNGGVVLGDKSNHVATLHLPQMLYIWPYITFFSIPHTYPFVFQGALAILAMIPVVLILEPLLVFSRHKILPRPVVVVFCIVLTMLIVQFNTIVHPFTLADNRHYPFYIFRILTRHPSIRFVAAPVYLICAWSVVQTLGASASFFFSDEDGIMDIETKRRTKAVPSESSSQIVCLNDASFGEGCTVSFVLIWLATSALTLVTAPLVEPRYFIIPWIMWRLRVPQAYAGEEEPHPYQELAANLKKKNTLLRKAGQVAARIIYREHDHRLWMETAWFLVINAVTGWVFLNKGFTWPQEPGNLQRFMW